MREIVHSQSVTYRSLSDAHYKRTTDYDFTAYTALHTPTDSEHPWGGLRPDAESASYILQADASLFADGGGDVPFLDALDSDKLNKLMNTGSDVSLSLLGKALEPRKGAIYAAATVSPLGGFKRETLRRTWHHIRRPSVSLPSGLPPLLSDTKMLARSLHVATFYNTLIPRYDQAAQDAARSRLGTMAAYHALRELPAETTIQYAYITDRIGSAYRAVLSEAMGMNPHEAETITHDGKPYAVSQSVVGKRDQQGAILHHLAIHIGETHQVN